MTSRSAVSSLIKGININFIDPYKNTEAITISNLDNKNIVTGDKCFVNSTEDITHNNNRIDKIYYVKFDSALNKVLLSEDETNWFPPNYSLTLYSGATYTFIQKNNVEYNNDTNPLLISTKNIYEKPRLIPLYDDNILYQVYDNDSSSWITKIPADPNGLVRNDTYYTQAFSSTITKRKIIFSPSQHADIFYITEQFNNPNITGGSLFVKPNNYKYGAAIVNSGLGVSYNLNSGKSFIIDDIFIVNNTNIFITPDKVNTSTPIQDHYKINCGIGTNDSRSTLDLGYMNNAFKIPSGNDTTEKPNGLMGMLRYNTDIKDYEGKSASDWGTLGGIQDIDMDTKIKLYPGESTDNLGQLEFLTENHTRLNLGYRGTAVNHKNPTATLDIKGNLATSNHNIGGVILGADTLNTDNYFNLSVNNNSTNSLDILSNNGGMILNINKSLNEDININKISILGNHTQIIDLDHNLFVNNINTLNYNSSFENFITSNNSEIFQNNSSNVFNNVNITISNNSIETYNTSLPLLNSSTNKTNNIMNNYNFNLSFNNYQIIDNNLTNIIYNNLNKTINSNYNQNIIDNNYNLIYGNSNIIYNNKLTESANSKISNYLSSTNLHFIQGSTNNYKKNFSNTINGDCIINITQDKNLSVNDSKVDTINNHQVNILNDSTKNIHYNNILTSNIDYNIRNKLNKINHISLSSNLNAGSLYSTIKTNTDIKIEKDFTNSTGQVNHISNLNSNKFIKQESTKNNYDNLYINQKTLEKLIHSNKHNITNLNSLKNYLNNFKINYSINKIITISGSSNNTTKNDSTLFCNQNFIININSNHTSDVNNNKSNNIKQNNTLSIDNDNNYYFNDNSSTLIQNNFDTKVSGFNKLYFNQINTKTFKNNFNINIYNNLNTIIENTDINNFQNNNSISVNNNNLEIFKSNFNKTISKKIETINNNSQYLVYNTYSNIVNTQDTKTYNNNNNITFNNNKTLIIKNNCITISNNLNKINATNTIHIKQNYSKKIGSSESNIHNIILKGNSQITFGNNYQTTILNNKNITTNLNIERNLQSNYNVLSNTKDILFKSNKNSVIKNDLIETVTGKLNYVIKNNCKIIQNNGEINLITK